MHTPGPWEIFDRKTIISGSSDSSGDIVAEVWETDDQEWDETVVAENALLIAAAPELLSSLRTLLTWADTFRKLHATSDAGPLACDISEARAAIARATGK